MLKKGDEFHNYRIEKLLQHGGMVSTYMVFHEKDKRHYVLKILEERWAQVPTIQKAFVGEYMLSKKIQHENLLFIDQVFVKESVVVLEFLDGITLEEQLRISPKIEPLKALKWAAQILRALNMLHQHQMVHLEVNPSNIFLVPGEDGEQKAILMDHGIAHRVKGGAIKPSFLEHSMFYWSPELISNPMTTKFRSDIYSLGTVLFEMMCGHRMIVGDSEYAIQRAIVQGERKALKEAAPHVPTSIALVIEQSIQTNPVSRYPTANAFMDALVRAVGGPLLDGEQDPGISSEHDIVLEDSEEVEISQESSSEKEDSVHSEQNSSSSKQTKRSHQTSATQKSSQQESTEEGSVQSPNNASESATSNIVVDDVERVESEVIQDNVSYDINGNVITLEHSADSWTEAKFVPPPKGVWSFHISARWIGVLFGLLFLCFMGAGYQAQTRSISIYLEGKPDWGETTLLWDGTQRSMLNFSDLPSGNHSLVVQGGVFEGESCTRCCWTRKFTVSIAMGFGEEKRTLSLENEQGYPRCPTLEANYIFSSIPTGYFDMGSEIEDVDRTEDELRHRVVLSQPFLMGQTEVTQDLYMLVTGQKPARYKDKYKPIESVSWYEAVDFCNQLSIIEGLSPCYDIDGDYVGWKAGLACSGYRLPTEAEWEYAARAGKDSFYAGGNDTTRIWYTKTSKGQTEAVAQKPSNAWRLFDMSGNVSEWVWDYYGTYSVENFRDPKGPIEGTRRVVRGGDWMHIARLARVQTRQESPPARRSAYIGFRIVQSIIEE